MIEQRSQRGWLQGGYLEQGGETALSRNGGRAGCTGSLEVAHFLMPGQLWAAGHAARRRRCLHYLLEVLRLFPLVVEVQGGRFLYLLHLLTSQLLLLLLSRCCILLSLHNWHL